MSPDDNGIPTEWGAVPTAAGEVARLHRELYVALRAEGFGPVQSLAILLASLVAGGCCE